MCWVLGLFYFLTLGTFLVMAAYLPKFLTVIFHLPAADAGFRAAVFVIFVGSMRPVGGWLADRYGGKPILLASFAGAATFALLLTIPRPLTFALGAFGLGFFIGLGNGAIFKLVPEYFPRSVGTATGVVGAMGALGGFFPPILLGSIRQATGSFAWGFVLLSLFSVGCLAVCAIAVPGGYGASRSICHEPSAARV
jgi:NNP family nitrate/nitrite transporter-like MFS transporter